MEKRRRARINASLSELKSLLMEAIKKEGTRQNKMEKADILEMAVKHLRHIQRQQFSGDGLGEHPLTGQSSSDTSEVGKYQLGFHACLQQVCKYLDSNRDEDVELKTKLLNHLANCMTGADYQTTSSSSMLSSPASSSCDIQVTVSPRPGGQLPSSSSSSSSCDRKSSVHLVSGSMLPMSSQSSEISQTDAARQEIRPKINVRNSCGDAVQQRVAQSTSDGILHAVLTSSSTNSVLVKPSMLSQKTPVPLLEARHSEDDRLSSNSFISSTSSAITQAGSVTEINNNSIILPALVNMAGPTTFTCVQQPNHLQQAHVYQQQPQLHQAQLQPQLFPALPDGSSIFTSTNPLQLIPTKTVNGDIAFFLSTTNLLSSAQIPSFSIPIITQPAVGHAQILAPPIPQSAIQIAVSYPTDDPQQPVAFIANSVQPIIQSVNSSAAVVPTSIPNISHQTTPLNLSSTTQQARLQTTHQLMPKRAVALPNAESEYCDHAQSHRKHASTASAVPQPGVSETGRYNCPPHITSPHVEHTDSMRQTPSSSWQNTAPADPTSFTLMKQLSSFKADVHRPALDSDLGRSVHDRHPDWQSQPNPGGSVSPGGGGSSRASTQRHFFRPWRE